MGKDAISIGANTFQFFTRNPRGGNAKEIVQSDADALAKLIEANDFAPLLAHAPYTLNLCSANPAVRKFAMEMMADDLVRMEQLPCHLYNFHPGGAGDQGIDAGIDFIVEALNQIMSEQQTTIILLETMSGKGSEVGSSFEELKTIIDRIDLKKQIGVCLDTCHVYDAGYDIVNNLDGVLEQFDKIIGLESLYCIHLNDSMNPMGSHKDRHQKVGEGTIGIDGFARIINHPRLRDLPFLLETPNELDGYAKEIKLLKSLYN